jgi:CBS-domain-containing membrane protein
VQDVMRTDLVTVSEQMDQEAVSLLFAQHNFMALPVVDAEGHIKGIVTVDDIRLVAMLRISDLDRNSRVRRRPPKRYRITQNHACAGDLLKSDSVSSPHAHAPRRCAD